MLSLINRGRMPQPVTQELDHLISRLRGIFSNLVDENGEQLPDADYQEGSWTPSLGGNTTYHTRNGSYVRKGRLVICQGQIHVNVLGTGSTGVITGLPFPPLTNGELVYAGSVGYFSGAASNFVMVGIYARPFFDNTAVVTGLTAAAATMTSPATFFGDGTVIHFTLPYTIPEGI